MVWMVEDSNQVCAHHFVDLAVNFGIELRCDKYTCGVLIKGGLDL
jgi:hypothetical protein